MSLPYQDLEALDTGSSSSASGGIILGSSDQWRTWYSTIKVTAKSLGVWKYLDPDASNPEKIPEEPRETQPGDAQEGAQQIIDLTDDNYKVFQRLLAHQDRQTLLFRWTQRNLDRIGQQIRRTVATSHQHLIADIENPRILLQALKDRFSPSEIERMLELRVRWLNKARSSPKDSQVDAWLTEWENLYTEAVGAQVPDTTNPRVAVYDFLCAARPLDENFYFYTYQKVFKETKEDKDVSFTSVINAFRQLRATSQKKRSGKGSAVGFATLDGQKEAGSTPAQSTRQKPSKQLPDCVCGQKHFFQSCPYLVVSARPSGWRPDPAIERKIPETIGKLSPFAKAKAEKLYKEVYSKNSVNFANVDSGDDTGLGFFTYGVTKQSDRAREDTLNQNIPRPVPYAFFTHNAENPLKSAWLIDSAANRHVTNNREAFISFKEISGNIQVGDTKTGVYGVGTVKIWGRNPETDRKVPLTVENVRYSPGFHTSLLSVGLMKKKGVIWDTQKEAIGTVSGRLVARVKEWDGLFMLDQAQFSSPAAFSTHPRRSALPLTSKATPKRWHRRLAHMYEQRVEKLAEMADGIELTAETRTEEDPEHCETCQLTKATRQVSRRAQAPVYGALGRVHFDLIQIKEGFNGDRWITHFYLDGIRYHHVETHPRKNGCQDAVRRFVATLRNWFNLPIRAFHYDNERSAGNTVRQYLEDCGFVIIHNLVGTPEMNSYAERSGGVIILASRSLLQDSHLPRSLWPEAVHAAVYILNRSPTRLPDGRWIIPQQEFHRLGTGIQIPINLSNLRIYGCRTYVRIQGIPQSDKMRPRAEIGYLTGYKTTNVWRVWFPRLHTVKLVRDAKFDENVSFKHHEHAQQPAPELVLEATEVVQEDELDIELEQALQRLSAQSQDLATSQTQAATSPVSDIQRATTPQESIEKEPYPAESEFSPAHSEPPIPVSLSSPLARQLTPSSTPSQIPSEHRHSLPAVPEQPIEVSTPPGPVRASLDPPRHPQAAITTSFLAGTPGHPFGFQPPHQRQEGISEDNVVEGKRKRKPPSDPYLASYFTYDDEEEQEGVLAAFATAISAPRPDQHRKHRDDLPPEPQNWKQAVSHTFSEGWLAAAGLEIESLGIRGTYTTSRRPSDRSIQVLPLTWVFTYKFDSNGFLQKLKARICVRGDLQAINPEEKRAATLAARTARSIFALVAAFDLETMQLDAVNAFLNSTLDEEVYTQMPEGFTDGESCWKLNKALYGLRKSPRLWQQEATRVLEELGFQAVPEDLCLFTRSGIIVFFYVDDIVIVYHRSKSSEASQLRTQLQKHWELRDMGEATWFLGIRILRDRQKHKLWLCQDSYLSSVAARYHLSSGRKYLSPLPVERMASFTGQATASQIHEYQQKVGSALYGTIITRPDAAKSASHLAEFLTNPGPQHLEAADRLIRYLDSTRYFALEYHPMHDLEPALQFASDASFGDHKDRKSSEGYLCKLFGGAVDWKAGKQKTVTTSTTEAELLALSEAAKSALWWKRLLAAVNLEYQNSEAMEIQCDNTQTVGLLTKETPQLSTKLRHVDIHNHWLRQAVQAGEIAIRWVPTKDMAADGLTKLLPAQNHSSFMRALGLTNIQHLIK